MGFWFTTKARNRRFEREHVLDVKLSSRQINTARMRLVSWVLGVSFSAFILVFLLWRGGSWMLDRLVYENPSFAIKVVDVQTDGVITVDQLRRWAGVHIGDNLLAMDLSRVKRDLELEPMVKSVSVERLLPGTLRLRVNEREPMAQILQPYAGPGHEQILYTLDDSGFIMLPLRPAQRSVQPSTNDWLPVLTGVNYAELTPGRPVESPQVRAALRLIASFERSPMAGLVDLRWIDLSAPDVLQVTTGQGCRVTFAASQLETQLRRWRSAHDFGLRRGKAVAALDLSVANNIPAVWVESSSLPPAPPKPLRPSRTTKRKNV
jgi:hypothetical protein